MAFSPIGLVASTEENWHEINCRASTGWQRLPYCSAVEVRASPGASSGKGFNWVLTFRNSSAKEQVLDILTPSRGPNNTDREDFHSGDVPGGISIPAHGQANGGAYLLGNDSIRIRYRTVDS
jgi:hypothetical protein